ncbi:hypothetical protein LINPERPRIM_LOCUS37030, partial [Linum perenne]
QVFFPTHGGKEYEHYYVFGVDFGRREKFILNSLPCAKAFQTDVVFKPTGTRLMMYVRPFLQERVGVDISTFPWRVPSSPVQPDTSSCGLYAARFMEHYVGRFRNEANWHTINVMKVDRLSYLCRLVKDRWNQVQHEVVVAANKYNDTLREEARLTKSLARSQARSQSRKQAPAAKKNAK